MRNFQCLLSVLKRSHICYYIISITVPAIRYNNNNLYIRLCNNNNLYIRLSFHCTYDTDEEIRDFEIYLSVILNDVILMLILPHIFKWFFDIYMYIYI